MGLHTRSSMVPNLFFPVSPASITKVLDTPNSTVSFLQCWYRFPFLQLCVFIRGNHLPPTSVVYCFPTIDSVISSIADDVSKDNILQSIHHIHHRKVIAYIIRGNCANHHLSCICTYSHMHLPPGT